MRTSMRNSDRRRPGFTLIELLIVIAIIGILAGLALVVGRQVSEGGRTSVTRDLLRVLSQSLDATLADRDGKVPWKYVDQSAAQNEFAIFDGRAFPVPGMPLPPTFQPPDRGDLSLPPVEPSVSLLLKATQGAAAIDSAVGGLDSMFGVRARFKAGLPTSPTDTNRIYTGMPTAPEIPNGARVPDPAPVNPPDTNPRADFGLIIKDPWGNPIRYVHPKFLGGTGRYFQNSGFVQRNLEHFQVRQGGVLQTYGTRRSLRPFNPSSNPSDIGDADEGVLDGGRGYFYSVGPDFDPGARADNVYIDPVKFPAETEKLK